MTLQAGDALYGFTVTRVRSVAALNGTLVEMTHDQTGAELVWLDNSETNKLFCVAFKTVPENDTGVFHILEHSVLCGSEKYPVREPFVELLKSSMNTFLNAMTFPDKTIYPVSSRNETDFLNLTGVYLDAVFAPSINTNPNIFYQEGWHIEENEEDARLNYKGVVLNEMKGATSSVDEVVEMGMQRMLYPDTCYRFVFGGDPEKIPTLSYEEFLENYRRFYHPSNSRIYLDGAVPLEKTLSLIDSYLSRFERRDENHEIAMQQPIPAAESINYYEVSDESELVGKAQFTIGKLACTWKDQTMDVAISVLCDYLAGTNDAPLKRAILESGLGQDVTLSLEDGTAQPWLMLRVHNVDDEKRDALGKLIYHTVSDLVEKGLDKDAMDASLNRMAFNLKEPQEPAALIRCIYSLTSWLHGGDPLQNLVFDDAIAGAREMLKDDSYEKLLSHLLLEKDGLMVLRTLPSVTVGEEFRAGENERLKNIRHSWSDEQKAANLELNKKLREWQQTPETPEQLASIPQLDLSEVNPEPERDYSSVTEVNGVTVLQNTVSCKGVLHITLYFRLTDCTAKELGRVSLLSSLLGKFSTAKHSALDLQKEIKRKLGRLNFGISVMSKLGVTKECTPCLVASCSVLEPNYADARDLLLEILTSTVFDQKDRVREIILQEDDEARQAMVMSGHAIAKQRVLSHISAAAAADDAMNGIEGIRMIHQLAEHFDEEYPGLMSLLNRIQAQTVCRSRMTASVAAAEPYDISDLIGAIPEGTAVPAAAGYTVDAPMKEGFRIPAQISYACTGGNLASVEKKYDGTGKIAAHILTFDYLWNKVRVLGGAYGVGTGIMPSGNVYCFSYRDPDPMNALTSYRGMGSYLREFCESDAALDKYIISTIGETEPLQSPREQGRASDARWFSGVTFESRCRSRRQTLNTTREQILSWADALDRITTEGPVCIIGHKDALDACASENLTVTDL